MTKPAPITRPAKAQSISATVSRPVEVDIQGTDPHQAALWDKLLKLIETEDLKGLKNLKLEGEPLVQENVTQEECKQQLLSLAPGKHPLTKVLVLGFIQKLEVSSKGG